MVGFHTFEKSLTIIQHRKGNQALLHEQRDSLAIDKPLHSAENQCSDPLSENLQARFKSEKPLDGNDCALSQGSARDGQGRKCATTLFLEIFQKL